MDWKDISDTVGKFAPMVGTILGGPAGGAVGALVSSALGVENTPDAVNAALKTDPTAAVKLAQIESDQKVKLQSLVLDAAKAVNATMQAEAKSEHWPTYSWRPAVGFSVAVDLVGSAMVALVAYGGVILFDGKPEVLGYIPAMIGSMAALVGVALPILGVASWHRGQMQRESQK